MTDRAPLEEAALPTRKYSLGEIDRMRRCVHELSIEYMMDGPKVSCFRLPADAKVEERLRTYLIAGTSPEELEDAVQKLKEKLDI
jgi:hypothetical protein